MIERLVRSLLIGCIGLCYHTNLHVASQIGIYRPIRIMTTGLSRQHRQVLGNFHGDLIDILPDFLLIRERQAETHPGFLFTEICERGRSSLVNTSVLFYLTAQGIFRASRHLPWYRKCDYKHYYKSYCYYRYCCELQNNVVSIDTITYIFPFPFQRRLLMFAGPGRGAKFLQLLWVLTT